MMDFLSVLQLLGWAAVGLVIIIFALTGGFDFGAGMLLPFVAKTDEERRVVINTVGPTWDGNQVWLITAGGAIFAIWPRVYAASFSGLYFAFLLVLWALFLRPVSFEYRSKFVRQTIRNFWDWALFVGSFLPALLLGVAVGNLFLGFPFQYDPISLRFFYGASMQDADMITGLLGLLRPFALLLGVFSLLMMLMHGAAYLCMRTEGAVLKRSQHILVKTPLILILLFAVAGFWLAFDIPGYHWVSMTDPINHPLSNQVTVSLGGWLQNYRLYPWLMLAPLLAFVSLWQVYRKAGREEFIKAFVASMFAIFCLICTVGFTLFPFIMPSMTHPEQSLLVWNASSSVNSLLGILIVAVIMLPIIFYYTAFVYRKLWGRGVRLSVEQIHLETKNLY